MKRVQVQIDEQTLVALRQAAYQQGRSISSLVRETLSEAFGPPKKRRQRTLKHYPFVGAGRSKQGKLSPVAERHDEALTEAFLPTNR